MRDSTWSFIYLESSMKYKDTNIWKTALQVLSFMMKVVRIMSWVCFLKPHLPFVWSSASIDGVFSQYYHELYRDVIYHEVALIFFENKPCTCVLENMFQTEADFGGILYKRCSQQFQKNSQKSNFIGVSIFIKVADLMSSTLLKRRLQH